MDAFDYLKAELAKDRELAQRAKDDHTTEYLRSFVESARLDDDGSPLMVEYIERFSPDRMLRRVEVMEKLVKDFLGEELTPGQLASPFTQIMVRQEYQQTIVPLLRMYSYEA
jgi:hypothetical protein